MRTPSTATAALSAWYLLGSAHGYMIDPGCGGDTQFVRDMVEQAFTMVNLASAAVKTTPVDANANWLGQQLFGVQDNVLKQLIESGFDAAAQPNAAGVTTGILTFENEVTGSPDQLRSSDVVIFCTTDRLSPMPNEKEKMFDSVAERAINGKDDGCQGFDFMWTYTFENHWDEIQICPWFLQYAKGKKYETKKDITSKRAWLAVSGLDKFITKLKLTPIDLLSLWDKTMLHEFMHTKAGGEKEDVGGGWDSAYGWKNAKNLAADGRGINNCDNWALFGSALFWFGQGSPIDENGKFTAQGTGASSSNNGRRWLGSGAGYAWSAMKADAVKKFT